MQIHVVKIDQFGWMHRFISLCLVHMSLTIRRGGEFPSKAIPSLYNLLDFGDRSRRGNTYTLNN